MMIPPIADFANIAHFGRVGNRAETIFGTFGLSDFVDADTSTISFDKLALISTLGLQKKLLMDMILAFTEVTGEAK